MPSRTHAQSGDSSLEFATLAYLGASLVHDDRVDEGMLLLDEALAAVAGRDVDDFTVVEEIFCQLFAACEYAHDVDRADQWIRIGEDIADPSKAAGRGSVLSHALRRVAHRRRPMGRSRRGAQRRRANLGSRTQLGFDRVPSCAWPTCGFDRAASRRPNNFCTASMATSRQPSHLPPYLSPAGRVGPRQSACSRGRWARSIPPVLPPCRCGRLSLMPTSPRATTVVPRTRRRSAHGTAPQKPRVLRAGNRSDGSGQTLSGRNDR